MYLDEFLRLHRISRSDVTRRLRADLNADVSDILVFAGSLAEGLGNHRSDLDVYRIRRSAVPLDPGVDPVEILDLGPAAADVETIEPARLDRLVERLAAVDSDADSDPRQAVAGFDEGEIKLLHQLRIGTAFRGAARFRPIRKAIRQRSLARILLDRAIAWMNVLHIDILGFLEAGDDESARTLLREFRFRLAGALLAGLGETNAAEKWQVRKLSACAKARPALCLPGGRTLPAIYETWLSLDRRIGEASAEESFRELLALRFTVVPWAQNRFLAGLSLADDEGAPPRADAQTFATSEILPSLRLDCQIQRDARGIWISRVASPEMMYLNGLAHELVMHFDGVSSAAMAAARLAQISSAQPNEIARSITDFRAVLADHTLI